MELEKLEQLNSLKEKGVITQEEFDEQKNKILYGQKKKTKPNKDISEIDKDKNIWNNYLSCFKKYFQFSGRATRYEYWGFVFINILASFVLSLTCFIFLCIYLFVESIFPQTIQCADYLSQKTCECVQFAVAKNFSFMDKVRVLLVGASEEEMQAYLNVGDALLCILK